MFSHSAMNEKRASDEPNALSLTALHQTLLSRRHKEHTTEISRLRIFLFLVCCRLRSKASCGCGTSRDTAGTSHLFACVVTLTPKISPVRVTVRAREKSPHTKGRGDGGLVG